MAHRVDTESNTITSVTIFREGRHSTRPLDPVIKTIYVLNSIDLYSNNYHMQ